MPTSHFQVHTYETSESQTLGEEEELSFSFNEAGSLSHKLP